MLLNTYYNFWNQSFTIQMDFKHKSHSHMIMVKTEIYSLITTLSPCNSIFPNQFLLTLCTISNSTSRWTTLMKITMPKSSWIKSHAHPKSQLFNIWNILHLANFANFWILTIPPPPQITSGQLILISTLTFQTHSPFELFQNWTNLQISNYVTIWHYWK